MLKGFAQVFLFDADLRFVDGTYFTGDAKEPQIRAALKCGQKLGFLR